MEKLNKGRFWIAYTNAMDDGGHTYHYDDIDWAWRVYQQDPTKYEHLAPFVDNEEEG